MTKIFQHSGSNPAHISVGAVLVNADGKILVHHLKREDAPKNFSIGSLEDVYYVMRESLENDETLEAAVHRGLQEEFGVVGEIKRYLGSMQVMIQEDGYVFEKTTLYFQVLLVSQGERSEYEESFTTIEWIEPDFLIEHMKIQGKNSSRTDMDESKIIETYVKYT